MFVKGVDIRKCVCYNQIIKEGAGRKARPGEKKMEFTNEAASRINKELFGVKNDYTGCTSLGTYRLMMYNIELNHPREINTLAPKLNSLIMPYYNDIKANPGKVL